LLEIARLLKDISRFWFISVWRKPMAFFKMFAPFILGGILLDLWNAPDCRSCNFF
jgi:hypothetical protein